jgi:hypothetical protein
MIPGGFGGPRPVGFDTPKRPHSDNPVSQDLAYWRETALLIMANSLLPCWNFLLQLFKPVQHDVDLWRRLLFACFHHEESLSVK